jgi:hypothetical protein
MDSADRKHARSTLIMLGMLATIGLTEEQRASMPDLPDVAGYQRRPEGYGVHLSKAERRGKSVAELQRLRAQRMSDA